MARLDLAGQKFFRWTVLKFAGINKHQNTTWLCRCDCGKEKVLVGGQLRLGQSKSCGCWNKEAVTIRGTKHGLTPRGVKMVEYMAWCAMKSRCYNEKNKRYFDYGGRGIIVCDRWLNSFEKFLADMGYRPSDSHSLERRNNNGHYEPTNCYWALLEQQSRNKRSNIIFAYNGASKILTDWAKIFKVHPQTIKWHLKSGKSFDDIAAFYISSKSISI